MHIVPSVALILSLFYASLFLYKKKAFSKVMKFILALVINKIFICSRPDKVKREVTIKEENTFEHEVVL